MTGANRPDLHLRGVEPGRDFAFETVDVRTVVAGDTVAGASVRIEPAIEVGNIFKLGTRYSEPLGATYLDESGHQQLIWMGCYGFGPARDRGGRASSSSPTSGHLVAARDRARSTSSWSRSASRAATSARSRTPSTRHCASEGLTTLYDDRDAGPGEKFADAELLGCPVRVTVGRRTLSSGELEVQIRRGRELRRCRCRAGRSRSRTRRPRSPSCGAASPEPGSEWGGRGTPTAHDASAVRHRPLRAAAGADALRSAAQPLDAAERDRVRPPGADPGVPGRRLLE